MNFWRCWSVQQYSFALPLVQRFKRGRSGDVQATLLDNLREVAEEKRHNQRVNVRTIDVGIGHDDNLLVAQLVNVRFFAVFTVHAETDAQLAWNDIVYFVALECLVPHGLFPHSESYREAAG